MLKKLFKSKRGEGYIGVCVLVLCSMMVIALTVHILPVFIEKSALDSYAVELVREAEISGRVGTETMARTRELSAKTGLNPSIQWSGTGKIQLNSEVTVFLTVQKNIGLFGGLGSFPVTLKAQATGKSEVFWK